MYQTTSELPPQVLNSLDDEDATAWLLAYNEAICDKTSIDDVRQARRIAWESVKENPSSFSFCIKASVEFPDLDGEIIDVPSICDQMDALIDRGGMVMDEHGNYNVATIWGWDKITEDGQMGVQVWGNVFGGDMVYDRARQEFIDGKNSLSVAGEATDGVYQCDERGCYVRRNVQQLMEISLCTVPCNPRATLIWYNDAAKLTKARQQKDAIGFGVQSYTIHRDYTTCPIHEMSDVFSKSGIKSEMHHIGIVVDKSDISKAKEVAERYGYSIVNTDKGITVMTKKSSLEYAFKRGYQMGCDDTFRKLNGIARW